jgi:hypothetical protein
MDDSAWRVAVRISLRFILGVWVCGATRLERVFFFALIFFGGIHGGSVARQGLFQYWQGRCVRGDRFDGLNVREVSAEVFSGAAFGAGRCAAVGRSRVVWRFMGA